MAIGEIERVGAVQVRRRTAEGRALLVCAYEDEEKCRGLRLDGALTLGEFRQRAAGLPREQEIVFYCA